MALPTDKPGDANLQRETLRKYFKQIDGLIKTGNFSEASNILQLARRIDPKNPFVTAFAERIRFFEEQKVPATPATPAGPDNKSTVPVTKAAGPDSKGAVPLTKAAGADIESAGPVVLPLGLRNQLTEEYLTKVQGLELQYSAAHDALFERERIMLAKREQKLREEYRLQMETVPPGGEATGAEVRARQSGLLEKLDRQLAQEREVFSKQYSQEHHRLQQAFLKEQQALLVEAQSKMLEEVRLLRQRETEELQRRREEVRRETERAYQEQRAQLNADHEKAAGNLSPGPGPNSLPMHDEIERSFRERMESSTRDHQKTLELFGFLMPQSKEEALQLYRKRMKDAYTGGIPTLAEVNVLIECKDLLELTFEEHLSIESNVRLELYIHEVEQLLRSRGRRAPQLPQELEDLKKRFNITPDEAVNLEQYYISGMERWTVKGRILLVDDDADLREMLGDILTKEGYQVTACVSVEEGMGKLSDGEWDLIISDLRFGPGQTDGFKFFTMVQEDPVLSRIPFLLLTAVADDLYVRSGAKLGVDDYLIKPVDPELMLDIVEGKIKRFRKNATEP